MDILLSLLLIAVIGVLKGANRRSEKEDISYLKAFAPDPDEQNNHRDIPRGGWNSGPYYDKQGIYRMPD